MTNFVLFVTGLIFFFWIGYLSGCEETKKIFQNECVNTGLYETPVVSIKCDVIAHKIDGKVFFITKEQ